MIKHLLSITIAGFMINSGAHAQAISHYSFTTPDGQQLDLLGVGRLSSKGAICWTPEGKLDQILTDTLDRCLQAQRDQPIYLAPSRKNRILLFRARDTQSRHVPLPSARYRSTMVKSIQTPTGDQYYLSFIQSPKERTTYTFTGSLNQRKPASVKLAYKPGAKGILNGIHYEIAAIRPVKVKDIPHEDLGNLRKGKLPFPLWQTILSRSEMQFTVDYHCIVAFDKAGNPIKTLKAKTPEDPPEDLSDYVQGRRIGFISMLLMNPFPNIDSQWAILDSEDNLYKLASNVNPKLISSIEIFYIRSFDFEFSNIQLDPSESKEIRR